MLEEYETTEIDPQSLDPDHLLVERIRAAETLEAAYAARNELAERYLGLAAATARKVVPPSMRRLQDDAKQEACCALLEAAARFDPGCGVPFGAFAAGMMANRIRTYLIRHGNPAQADRLGRALGRLRRLGGDQTDVLTDAELAAKAGLSEADVRNARPWLNPVVPLDGIDAEGNSFESRISAGDGSPKESLAMQDAIAQLRELVDRLHWKDRHIVTAVFGLDGSEPETIRDAVVALGCSSQRGSVRLRRALRRLREAWRD